MVVLWHEKCKWAKTVLLLDVTNMSLFLLNLKSLFNLLEFQRLVLNYSPPARVHDLPRNQKVRPLLFLPGSQRRKMKQQQRNQSGMALDAF